MKKFLILFFFSTIASAKIFVIEKDKEIPFEAAQIKKSFKKDISEYIDSTAPVLKGMGDTRFKLSLLAVGPVIAGSVGIGPWQVVGNVGFYVLFVRNKEQL